MPHLDDSIPVEWVSPDIIRKYFNENQLYQKTKSGELTTYTKRSSHPDQPPIGEPVCTHSQIVYYYTSDGDPVAIVHQYLRPDGTIGGSGKPDPKRIFLKNRIISVKTKSK